MARMKRIYAFILLTIVANAVTISKGQTSRYLTAVEVLGFNQEIPIAPRQYTDLSKRTIIDDLDLDEDIENQIIVLHPAPGLATEFRIEQRHETSVTVGDEGPHLDLRDWKHYYSEWKGIERVGENRFLTSRIDQSENSRFPQVTAGEIKRSVRKAGGKRWAKLVRDIKSPNDYPAMVGISRISFRVMAKEGQRWRVIAVLHFNTPMGC